MLQTTVKPRGFSLVELVIVMVILGVLAAIAIPRISFGSRNAEDATLRSSLQAMRNGIDWYYSEHGNTFPVAGSQDGVLFVNQMTLYSRADGMTSAHSDTTFPYGPYIRGKFSKLPVGRNAGKDKVHVVNNVNPLTAVPAEDAGWVYNSITGQIIANCADTETGSDGIPYNQY